MKTEPGSDAEEEGESGQPRTFRYPSAPPTPVPRGKNKPITKPTPKPRHTKSHQQPVDVVDLPIPYSLQARINPICPAELA